MQCDATVYSRGLNFPRPHRCQHKATHGTKRWLHSPERKKPERDPSKDNLLRARWLAKYALKNKTCRNCLRYEAGSGRCSLLLVDVRASDTCGKFQPNYHDAISYGS